MDRKREEDQRTFKIANFHFGLEKKNLSEAQTPIIEKPKSQSQRKTWKPKQLAFKVSQMFIF